MFGCSLLATGIDVGEMQMDTLQSTYHHSYKNQRSTSEPNVNQVIVSDPHKRQVRKEKDRLVWFGSGYNILSKVYDISWV